jgi:hypothetical protein
MFSFIGQVSMQTGYHFSSNNVSQSPDLKRLIQIMSSQVNDFTLYLFDTKWTHFIYFK